MIAPVCAGSYTGNVPAPPARSSPLISNGVLIASTVVVICLSPPRLCLCRSEVAVLRSGTVEKHGLGLEERQEPVDAALAADAGLLEPAVPHVKVRLEPVVADGPGPHLPGDQRAHRGRRVERVADPYLVEDDRGGLAAEF